MNKHRFTWILVLVFLLVGAMAVMADAHTYEEDWDQIRGTESEKCELVGQEGRSEEGWIHWVFNTKGDSTNASLVLGGIGFGTYAPGEPLNAEVWHFYTPYFDLEGLTATIYLYGGLPGEGGGLVISDYCPGAFENLDVTKTVETSFTREHFWDIDKKVETEYEHELDGFPKIWLYTDGRGDETATWTVDVTYEGYEDSDFNVSGMITIENTGTLDAVITAVDDVLGGVLIPTSCDYILPYTLPVGDTLYCFYDEDGYFEGDNVVTVTTERDTYSATEPIVWGDPDPEINKTVNVKDISDLFGTVNLGTVTAPNDAQFTYTKDFAWADYGQEGCGSYQYDNTATIVETEQSASATLKVNVQCFIYESAWAEGVGEGVNAHAFCDNGFDNWGWSNLIGQGYDGNWPLWAGAAQCDTSKGTQVGTVNVNYDGINVIVTFNVDGEYDVPETHVYADTEMFPTTPQGSPTTAPGRYYNASPFSGEDVYVIAHAVVGYPDPDFGP
jgi:hypothetical protein